MSKILVPFHITDYAGSPGSVQPGFKKFYLKNGYFKLFDGTAVSDLVLDRPLDGFVPLIGTITSSDTVLTALEKLQNAITSVVIPTSNLQQVVDVGNAISNYGGIGTATIQSTNFSNNRTLYLNNNSFATIKIEDNLNANHYVIIDIDTINLNGVSYNWSSIVSPPVIGTWGTLNYPTWVSGSPFVKMTAAGTFVLDNTVYYPNSNPLGFITSSALTGYVPYTGATQAVDLGAFNLTVNSISVGKGSGTGIDNTAVGNLALSSATTAAANIALGYWSLKLNSTGNSNVAVGSLALQNVTTGEGNIGIGTNAGGRITTGYRNICIGLVAGSNINTGYYNTIMGDFAGYFNTTGHSNTLIGKNTGFNFGTGNQNSALGQEAGYHNAYGSRSVFIGFQAGALAGSGSAYALNVNNSILIGYDTRVSATPATNQIVIGDSAIGNGDNTVTLGNTSILITRLRGIVKGGSFVKDGGTNLEFLMADGSTSTAPSLAGFVPYLGATTTVNLGTQNFYADGSTGFGTTTPIAKVHIAGSTGLAFSTNTSNHGMAYIKTVVMDSLIAPYEGDLTFSAPYWNGSLYSFPERVRIAAHTGYFGINQTVPTQHLHVEGNSRITGAVYDSANLPGTAGQYLSSTVTGTSWASLPSLTGFVPTSRTLTINGTTYDLSADRSWTISSGGLPTGGTAGQILTKIDSVDYNATWQDNYADWTSVVKHIVKNNGLNGTITKGTAVYVTGSDGTNMLVGRASNVSEATSSKTMGLMQSDITTTGGTQTGFVITEGLLSGLNTAGQTAGDPVWLGVNGALIYGLINKPYAPNHLVFIGIVTKVSAGSGEIFVKVQNGFELKEIHDVDLITTTPINGHILGFNGTLWVNKTIAGWLGYTPASLPIKLTSQTLVVGSWTLVGIYYTYSFSNVNVTTSCDVAVTPQNASYLTAYNAQVLPYVGVAAGVATLYSQFPPAADMVVDIVITQTI